MTQKIKIIILLIFVVSAFHPFKAYGGYEILDEIRYTTHIKPIIKANCTECHDADAAPEHDAFKENREKWIAKEKAMRLDTYSHLIFYIAWPDTGSLMRKLDDGKNTKDGKTGEMYEYLGINEEERQRNLKIFKEWIGNWTLKRWDEISKEELDRIDVKY